MKKIGIILTILVSIILITGCETEKKDPNAPAGLKEVTGKIEKANLNDDGNIVIEEKDITDKVVYISYEYEGVTIGLLAVRNSEGKVIVVVNTCQSCGGSPYAYFVLDVCSLNSEEYLNHQYPDDATIKLFKSEAACEILFISFTKSNFFS